MEKLNLNRFLQDPEDHLGQYTLHAVLVHSGESTGHFIRAFHYNLKSLSPFFFSIFDGKVSHPWIQIPKKQLNF